VITADCTVSSTSIIDSTAPVAHITFPPPHTLTESSTITVRGTASDANDITTVRVNGVDATTNNGYATWAVPITLGSGPNTLTVETIDSENNTEPNVAQAQVSVIGVLLHHIHGLAMDSANNRVLVADAALNAVMAVDLTTGTRTIISDLTTPDAENVLSRPKSLVLDSANNRALVLDWNLNALVAVDLVTGARTIVSNDLVPKTDYVLEGLRDLVLDSAQNRVLVVAESLDAVIAVDLVTGVRTIVSSGITSNGVNALSEPVFRDPNDLVLDSANNRALVLDSRLDTVVAVDLITGGRTIISDDAFGLFSTPESLVLDSTNNRVLIIENFWFKGGKVVAVNLSTGLGTIIYDSTTADAINALSNPKSLALDSANNRVLVVDSDLDAVVAMDLSTGARIIVSGPTIPDASNILSYPSDLVFDSSNNRVLVVDSGLDAVVAVDLTTGARTIVSDSTTPDAIHSLTDPYDLVLDSTNNRVLVVDGYLADAVVAVDLTTGARTIISDAAMPNASNSLLDPRALVLDSANNRVLLLDAVLNAVMAVDLVDGQRVTLSR